MEDYRLICLRYVLQLEQGITDILENHPFGELIAKCLIAWELSCEVGSIFKYKGLDPSSRIKICMKANIKWLFEGNESLMKRCWEQNGASQFMYPDKTFDDFRESIICNRVESEKIKTALTDYITHFDFKQHEQSTDNTTTINSRHIKTIILSIITFITLIVVAVTVLIYAGYDKATNASVGKYVYLDQLGVVHIDRKCCFSSGNSMTKEERLLAKRGVEFVDTSDFHGCSYDNNYGYWYVKKDFEYCPICITDDAYTELSRILKANREKLREDY